MRSISDAFDFMILTKSNFSRNVCRLIGGWFSSFLQTQIIFEITNCFYLFSGITIGNEAHWFFATVRNMQWDLLDCNSLDNAAMDFWILGEIDQTPKEDI